MSEQKNMKYGGSKASTTPPRDSKTGLAMRDPVIDPITGLSMERTDAKQLPNHLLRNLIEALKRGATVSEALKLCVCPIMMEMLVDPVVSWSGHTYERTAFEETFKRDPREPQTREVHDKTKHKHVSVPNRTLKEWILRNAPKEDQKEAATAVAEAKKQLKYSYFQWKVDLLLDDSCEYAWRTYPMCVQEHLVEAHKTGKKTTVRVNAHHYVHLDALMQFSEDGKRRRPVRLITGKKPERQQPCWFIQVDAQVDDTKTSTGFELANFAPLSLDDSQRLELEFQKPENERTLVCIGPRTDFLADVTFMVVTIGRDSTQALKRVV